MVTYIRNANNKLRRKEKHHTNQVKNIGVVYSKGRERERKKNTNIVQCKQNQKELHSIPKVE